MSAARQLSLGLSAPAPGAPPKAPPPAPKPAVPLIEYDWGGAYILERGEPCIVCGKPTTVRVGHPDGDRSADPRGVCGLQARCIVDPEEYDFEIGAKGFACWDCLNEHGREGEQRVLDRAARVLGWLRAASVAAPTAAPANESNALPRTRLGEDVLRVLSACVVDGQSVRITGGQLDRKLYVRVDEALRALGGKWNRKARAHAFEDDPAAALDAAITSGAVVRPADLGWFPTPDALARDVVSRLGDVRGARALEPSAGEGAIARALRDAGADVTCVEIDPKRVEKLRAAGFRVECADFLAWNTTERFGVVAANPPFGKRQDVKHIRHAMSLLKPGGRLVAIMSGGIEFRADALSIEFRELVSSLNGSIERLAEGSFVESGTSVRTCVVDVVVP